MQRRLLSLLALFALLASSLSTTQARPAATAQPAAVRFATFNASLNRSTAGQLLNDLSNGADQQARNVAEIIQRVNPDVVLINEFDYEPDQLAAQLFQQNYLSIGQNGAAPIEYPYVYVAPSNTGIPSGLDLDNNGSVGGPNDAFGFGFFPGQFGMALFSKYPIVTPKVRTFQTFLWKDMPAALLPDNPNTPEPADWYSEEELAVFRLSSKSHWDVPIRVGTTTIHVLASHPTPPVFDGPEDRNGTRNHDEIRFFADYVTPGAGSYIYDDNGRFGGLQRNARFVIMGDQNADPADGDSTADAILQLTQNIYINTSVTPDSEGGVEQAALQGGANAAHTGDPAFDTADFADNTPGNLRADYVLPSRALRIVDAGVFWPLSSDPLFRLVGTFTPGLPGGFPSSDHRLVWADVDALPLVPARRETQNVLDEFEIAPNGERLGDADDPAVWIHPTTPSQSIIVGVLKDGGLDVYDLRGRVLQSIVPNPIGSERYNNVDIVYNFPLGGKKVDLVVATDRANDLLRFWVVDPQTRTLGDVTAPGKPRVFTAGDDAALDEQTTAYGIALYRTQGTFYAFVSRRSTNVLGQFRFFDNGSGQVAWEQLRLAEFPLVDDDLEESQFEGMVVDQQQGLLYAGQEGRGIWKLDAATLGSSMRILIDEVAPAGTNLKADVEGLTIYYGSGGRGYLIASSQGDNTFAVYTREGENRYLGSFGVTGGGGTIDSVEESDGAEVIAASLGAEYRFGIFITQDGANDPAVLVDDDGELENVNTNFKLVNWLFIARSFEPPLRIEPNAYDPRR
ncbi:phytase [Candidatus Gracilibacteria bacterium]|nr:phytase [Candidatus Gracilibacteria bacterium]